MVLIDMRMPQCCLDCWSMRLFKKTWKCSITRKDIKLEYRLTRPQWCPMKEVQE